MKKSAAEWKTLSSQQKAPFEKQYQETKEKYAKEKEEYDKKFVTPFKNSTPLGLITAHFAATGAVKNPESGPVIAERGRQTK